MAVSKKLHLPRYANGIKSDFKIWLNEHKNAASERTKNKYAISAGSFSVKDKHRSGFKSLKSSSFDGILVKTICDEIRA